MRIRTLAVAAALTLSANGQGWARETFANAPCNGTYELHVGQAVGAAQGFSMPVGTGPRTLTANVQMNQCAREMVVTIQGRPVVLAQEIVDDAAYSGMVDMGDGVSRTLRVVRGADRNLRGGLVATDGTLTVTRPVWLMASNLAETKFEDCLDDKEPEKPKRGMSESEANAATVLTQRGYAPADGFSLSDYFRSSREPANPLNNYWRTPPGQTSVGFVTNIEGRILPRTDVALARHDSEAAICDDKDYLDPPRVAVIFTTYPLDPLINDDATVAVRVIDIETSKILSMSLGDPSPGRTDFERSAMENALEGLEWPIGQMKGPYKRSP